MQNDFDLADVPVIDASDLRFVLGLLIDDGQGLALLRGMHEDEIREIENRVWMEFRGTREMRLAVALRFRALLDVFAGRRLKALFLDRGYRLFAALAQEAAVMPLNIRFGFNAQRLLLAADAKTAISQGISERIPSLAIAA